MTLEQEREYRSLTTVAKRATWLLNQGVTAEVDIGTGLDLVWRVSAADVALPGRFTGTREEAIQQGIAWLEEKARS